MAIRLLFLVVGLALGVPAGIALDRHHLHPGPPTGQKAVLGEWVAESKDRITFRTDGTYDKAVKIHFMAVGNAEMPPEDQQYRRTTGQYAWEGELLVLTAPQTNQEKVRVAATENELTLKFADGRVERYSRGK